MAEQEQASPERRTLPSCDCGRHYLRPSEQPQWDSDPSWCPVTEVERSHGVSLRTVAAARAFLGT